MDRFFSFLPENLVEFVEAGNSCITAERVQWAAITLLTLAAIYAGYRYSLCLKEAAVPFNVPLPVELRTSAGGKRWEEITGVEKRVLEDQVRGVSVARGSFVAVAIVSRRLS